VEVILTGGREGGVLDLAIAHSATAK